MVEMAQHTQEGGRKATGLGMIDDKGESAEPKKRRRGVPVAAPHRAAPALVTISQGKADDAFGDTDSTSR